MHQKSKKIQLFAKLERLLNIRKHNAYTCVHVKSYTYPSHRPITQNQKALKTLQIMLVLLFIKAKERAKEKVTMQTFNFLYLELVLNLLKSIFKNFFLYIFFLSTR